MIGTSIGGIETLLDGHDVLRERGARRLSPFVVPMTLPNMTAGFVSMHWGFRGPIACPVGACASGAQALGAAARLIERGDADVVIAGGTDAADPAARGRRLRGDARALDAQRRARRARAAPSTAIATAS